MMDARRCLNRKTTRAFSGWPRLFDFSQRKTVVRGCFSRLLGHPATAIFGACILVGESTRRMQRPLARNFRCAVGPALLRAST